MMIDLKEIHEQLPKGLQRALKVYVMPSLPWETAVATFVDTRDRTKEIELQEDGRLSEISILELCVWA
ncbi:MAG: hypothetical protein ACREE4_06060 [Stellaceae bacterium]